MDKNRVRTCSSKNCKEKYYAKGFCKHHYQHSSERKAIRSTPEFKMKEKERHKKWYSDPKVKARLKKYRARSEVKARIKERQSSPKYKAYQKDYELRPKVKAIRKERRATEEYKVVRRKRRATPENKAKARKYERTPKHKAWRKERRATEEYQFKSRSWRLKTRLKVLQYYSKQLSKSNIPCCRCCGESNSAFLAIDHIAGRKKMDSEPELVKLGYSSSLISGTLQRWIIVNNFPKGFQILCHNCNIAKGHSKDNKCPHEK